MSLAFAEWEPIYEQILSDLGYDRGADGRARDVLAALVEGASTYDVGTLDWEGKTVAIAGGAPTLSDELDVVRGADTVVAASVAADCLEREGIPVDCLVTDLDKNPETAKSLSERGVPVAVHAHGDNISSLKQVVPGIRTASLVPTTQAEPVGPVRNFGGFTDGDRAAFLADAVGAETLRFPGWDFDDPGVSAEKARKLQWAERLLFWLERRRGEQFELLSGRRDAIGTESLPVG